MTTEIKLIPLGGLGRIGLNAMILEVGDADYLLDCGMGFPGGREPGAEQVLPDLGILRERSDRFQGIILTHGHEDHVGALSHVLPILQVPVYGPPFALGLARRRLKENDVSASEGLFPVSPESEVKLGEVTFQFLRVTHSMPDCLSLVIRTPVGVIIHTGDWKMDPEPVDGQDFDREGFGKLGDEGVLLLLGDSTNAEVDGRTRSEREVGRNLETQIDACEGRAIVTLFSSNIHRLNLLQAIGKKVGRSLCLLGRSLENNVPLAQELGITSIESGALVAPEHLGSMPDREVLVLATGTQGEPLSTMGKASVGTHPYLKVKPGDTVFYSARVIPGNEGEVYEMFGELTRQGAEVIHGGRAAIHASGHAKRDEVRELLELVRPRFFVPIHGEQSFLRRHAEIADAVGVERAMVVENGEVLRVTNQTMEKVEPIPIHAYFSEGGETGRRSEMGYTERVQLAFNGGIGLRVRVRRTKDSLVANVSMVTKGLYTDRETWRGMAEEYVKAEVERLPAYTPSTDVQDACEMLARRFFKKRIGRKPLVFLFYEEENGDV